MLSLLVLWHLYIFGFCPAARYCVAPGHEAACSGGHDTVERRPLDRYHRHPNGRLLEQLRRT
jgi:hypothetical protein